MDLLDFARGPALQVALAVFVFGTLWRLAGVLLLPRVGDRSAPRDGAAPPWRSALGSIVRRMWPRRELAGPTLFVTVNSYVFHVGLAVVVFGFGPHVLFIQHLLGLSWPTLPSNLVFGVGVVTLASLLAVLGRRLTHPVTRLLSRATDYVSWVLTAAKSPRAAMRVASASATSGS